MPMSDLDSQLSAVKTMLSILDLEEIDRDLWRGVSPDKNRYRVFGGQVIAQALMAAMRTVSDRRVHSLHGYFILAGDPSKPILYQVDRIRDGRSFATRTVRAIQNGEAIFAMMASFQAAETGLHHQVPMPDVPRPDALPNEAEIRERYVPLLTPIRQHYWRAERAIELRPVDPDQYFQRDEASTTQHVWVRAKGIIPPEPDLHAVILAYASDMTLLDGATVAHGRSIIDPEFQGASLDHAIWFHEDFRVDQWLLYAQDSPWTGGGRGIGRGLIFTEEGRLVASVTQEGLMRLRRPKDGGAA